MPCIHPSKLLVKMSAIAISAYRICIFTPTSFELDIHQRQHLYLTKASFQLLPERLKSGQKGRGDCLAKLLKHKYESIQWVIVVDYSLAVEFR